MKTMPERDDCLVVGVPDERFGQAVNAVIQPAGSLELSPELIEAFCRDKMAGYKRPRKFVIVEQVKRAPNGKPDYKWAHQQAIDAAS